MLSQCWALPRAMLKHDKICDFYGNGLIATQFGNRIGNICGLIWWWDKKYLWASLVIGWEIFMEAQYDLWVIFGFLFFGEWINKI